MRWGHISFFHFIKCTFGIYVLNLLKSWTKMNKEMILVNLRINFLKKCKSHGICPNHLHNNSFVTLKFHTQKHKKMANNKNKRYMYTLLKLEIII